LLLKAVFEIKTQLNQIDLLVEGGDSKILKAASLNILLENTSDEIVDPPEKPGPNGF